MLKFIDDGICFGLACKLKEAFFRAVVTGLVPELLSSFE
jgi:hypothetical protein